MALDGDWVNKVQFGKVVHTLVLGPLLLLLRSQFGDWEEGSAIVLWSSGLMHEVAISASTNRVVLLPVSKPLSSLSLGQFVKSYVSFCQAEQMPLSCNSSSIIRKDFDF